MTDYATVEQLQAVTDNFKFNWETAFCQYESMMLAVANLEKQVSTLNDALHHTIAALEKLQNAQ